MLAALGPAAEAPGAPSKPLRLTAAMATEWTAQQDQELRQMVEVEGEGEWEHKARRFTTRVMGHCARPNCQRRPGRSGIVLTPRCFCGTSDVDPGTMLRQRWRELVELPRKGGFAGAGDEGEREGGFEPQAPLGEGVPTQVV